MSKAATLGEFEQVVILAVLRLKDDAYGVPIRAEILQRTGRAPSPGALYTTLERLEEKSFISSKLGAATAVRGGRAKRYVKVTSQGLAAVARAQKSYQRLLEGIQLPGFAHA
jgi:PadR family transcriptional regulator, regulatory protein PadR